MRKCDRCAKSFQVGMNVSQSHVRTKKRSSPNLHVARIEVRGSKKKMTLCTKCLRIMRKEGVEKKRAIKTEVREEKTIEVAATNPA